MQTTIKIAVLAVLSVLTGCATIVKDVNQPVKVETYSKDNTMLEGAKCTAKNERGEWVATTPGNVVVHRSGQDLIVKCDKENQASGFATLISRANGGMFGNILFGGGIGAIIDHNKGTAYSYPDWVRVIMGDNLVYDRKNNKEGEVMLGKAANPDDLKKIQQEKVAEEQAAIQAAKENTEKTQVQ